MADAQQHPEDEQKKPAEKGKRYVLLSAVTTPLYVIETYDDAEKARARLQREQTRIALDELFAYARALEKGLTPNAPNSAFMRLLVRQAMRGMMDTPSIADSLGWPAIKPEEIITASHNANFIQLLEVDV